MPSDFQVEPQAIRDFGQHIARCGQDVADGIAYLDRNGNLSWDQVGATNFLFGLKGAHERVVTELRERLTHLKDVHGRSVTELENTAAYYEETDTGAARDFDQELSDPGRRVWPGGAP